MYRATVKFPFNTAITAKSRNGKFNWKQHSKKVLPLAEAMKAVDGILDCEIYRYEMEVSYWPAAISEAEVRTLALDEVRKAADNPKLSLFSQRGDKEPTIVLPESKPNYRQSVRATFNTNLCKQQIMDEEQIHALLEGIETPLKDVDGFVSIEYHVNSVTLIFDTRRNDVDSIKGHLSTTLNRFATPEENPGIFPYLDGTGKALEISFKVSGA